MNLAKKICSLCLTLIAMLNSVSATNYIVATKTDLQAKYTAALPGDTVIVSNGTYDWGQLVLSNSNGTTTSNWIVIKAQALNGVVFTGSTYMQFGGKRIMITGFKFANGNAGFNDVIQFRSSTSVSNYAQYCRLNNITIVNYSSDSTGAAAGLSTASDNKWVSLYGIRNRIDHCTFIDKYNGGATVVVWYDNSNYPQQSTSTYHLIDSNYFNKRSFISGNGGESIRVGVGLTSSTYGYNVVEYNLFENMTQEEPEIISNKSGFNTYRYNTFKNCAGGLTLRRGRYCSVYGNFFIVNKSTVIDDYGIRIIDKGHKVFNNYIESVNSNKNSLTSMRCPIILYNGTNSVNDTTNPSLVSGYMPGDSCIIAFNTIVNCEGGAGISLGFTDNGSNTFQPLGITIANNLIKMTSGQAAYNPPTNTTLTYAASGNIYNAPSGVGLSSSTGFTSATLTFGSRVNGILMPPSLVQDAAINTSSYSSMLNGLDVNGLTRSSIYDVGCDEINSTGSVIATPLDSTQVGAGMPLIAIIKSFTPSIAYNGTTVTIKGTNFVNVSNVNFGGTNASSYTVQNDSTITAVVSSGTNGNVSVTANGFVSTITGFVFCSPLTSTTNTSICPSALPYSWNGSRAAAGTYTFTTTNHQGCDSTATLILTINLTTTSSSSLTIPSTSLPYIWNNLTFYNSGAQTAHFLNSKGCDSGATLNLSVTNSIPSYLPTNGLIAYWPFNCNANDESGNGNHGTVNGATLTLDRKGNSNNSYDFNNNTISINNPQIAAFGTSSFSCNVWIKTNTTSCGNFVRYDNCLTGALWGIRIGPAIDVSVGKVQGLECSASRIGNSVASSLTYNDNNWHNFTFIRDVALMKDLLYADGKLIAQTSFTSINNINVTGNPLLFGSCGSGYEKFIGKIDDIVLYSRALTQAEVTQLYSNCPTNSTSTTNVSICPSQLPYSWNGSRTLAGTYTFTTTNSQGCDSTATLNLTVKTNTTSTTNVSICPSALPYSWNGSRTVAGTYTFTTTNSQGCDSTATLNLTVKTNTTSTTAVSRCPSQMPFLWNGINRTTAGTYTFTTTNSQGCDSTATLNLTVKTNTTSTTNVSICPSQLPYNWNGSRAVAGTYTFTTTNSQGCDSTATLNLTVKTNTTSTTNVSICPSALPYSWNGSRTVAGTYTFTTTNSQGCDSTATLNLTVKTNTTSTTAVSRCPSQMPFLWNGINRTTAGTYTFTTTNSQGCDSTATLNLTVKTNTTSTTNINVCPSALPYSWNGSRTVAGTYTFTTTNSQGCDSTATLNLTVKTNTTSTTNVSICPSQLPYSWNGSRTVGGTYTFTTTNSQGCDSTATLNLTVKTNTTSTTNVSICPSALPYSWNGSRAAAGTYTFTTSNSQGCDSTATLNLTVKTNTTSTTNVSICPSALPYSWNGNRTVAGTYTFTTTNSQGCDSVATLNLTVKTNTNSTTAVSRCPSQMPFLWNGINRTTAGTYTFTTTNSQGCDSTATLNLVIKTISTSTTNVSICTSALPYSWNGSRTLAGTYTFTTTNSQGCDSTATLNLTVKTNTTSTTNVSICPSALPYSWNGSRALAGTYTFTTTNSQGCDSTATLNLTVKTNTTSTTNVSICPSALPYSWNGSRALAGTYTFTTTNSQGCDSSATLNLTLKTNTTSTTNVSICPSQLPYNWNGSRASAGTYTFTTTNSQGCDSIATLNLTVTSLTPSVSISTSSTTVCSNDIVTFTANGVNEGTAPIYQWKKNSNNVATGSSINFPANTLSNGDIITCVLTGNNPCQTTATSTSNAITMTVQQSPAAPTIISRFGNNTSAFAVCSLGTIESLYPSVANGIWSSSNPSVAAVANGGSTTSTSNITAVSNGTANIIYTLQTIGTTCTTSTTVAVTVAQQATPNAVTGVSNICVGGTTTFATTSTGGVFSTTGRLNINAASGFATATSYGATTVKYTITNAAGCSAYSALNVIVNASPATPSFSYASGITNPQTTSVGGVISLCANRIFTLVGNPANGVWSKTGAWTITPTGTNATNVSVNTGNINGAVSVTYEITNVNGCKNNRTINANVVSCSSKGINNQLAVNKQLVIYPNPAKNFIELKVNDFSENFVLIIRDIYGNIKQQTKVNNFLTKVSLENLANGYYSMQILENLELVKHITFIVSK